jgi:stage II sporulation protein D
MIRVAVADGLRSVEVGGGPILVTDPEGQPLLEGRPATVRVTLRNGGLDVEGRRVAAARLRPADAGALKLNGRDYPGWLDVLRNGDGLVVVNELPFEQYLAGALKAEASDKWPMEMLKAQAIVARTYAAYHRMLNAAKPYHLVASTAHQQYVGRVAEASPAWEAVRATEGRVLLWEGRLFPAFYHSDSGGYTEDPRLVFAARNMPALRAVRSEFSGYSPYFVWNLNIPIGQLSEILRKGGVWVGTVTRLEVVERSRSLRVVRLAVHGTRGTIQLSGNDFRRILGYDMLKSTLFAVAVDGQYARFAGRGYGHGVGLDQWGAKAMAEQGYAAPQILEYYYPGAALSTLQ